MAKSHLQSLSPERAETITCLAEAVAEQHQTSKGTDLDSILADASLDLTYDSFSEDFDGLLIKDSHGFRVVCNTTTGNVPASSRSRFTISHELGHYFIDEHRKVLETCLMPSFGERAIEDNIMEREADLFASRLLMPRELVRNACKVSGGGLEGIRKLATRFSVSLKCAAIRYVDEDLVPCCLTFRDWERKLLWRWFSRGLWLAGIRKAEESPVAKGATDQVFSEGPDQEVSVMSSGATARYLFSGVDGQLMNELFTEEAIALGEYGVLSLYSSQSGELAKIADILERRFSGS
jgi:hypothetical protein